MSQNVVYEIVESRLEDYINSIIRETLYIIKK